MILSFSVSYLLNRHESSTDIAKNGEWPQNEKQISKNPILCYKEFNKR